MTTFDSALSVAGEFGVPGTGTIGAAIGFVGGLFGGHPEWQADAAAGRIAPCATRIDLTNGRSSPNVAPEYMGITTIDPQELLLALQSAPQGIKGLVEAGGPNASSLHTVEGLRTTVSVYHPKVVPYVGTLVGLANVSAYVAHGTYNCNPSSDSNRDTAAHAAVLIGDYRKRLAIERAQQQSALGVIKPGEPGGLTPSQLGIAGAVGLLLLKVL